MDGLHLVVNGAELVPLHSTPPNRSGRKVERLTPVRRSISIQRFAEGKARPLMIRDIHVLVMPRSRASAALAPRGLLAK